MEPARLWAYGVFGCFLAVVGVVLGWSEVVYTESDDADLAMGLIGLPAPIPIALLLLRFRRWAQAARAAPRPARACFVAGNPWNSFAVVMMLWDSDGRQWEQKVMWEPWMAVRGKTIRRVSARRGPGRWGRFVVEVPGRGRIWPASWPKPGHGKPGRWTDGLTPGGSRPLTTAVVCLACAPFALVGGAAAWAGMVAYALASWQLSGGSGRWRPGAS